MSRDHFTYHRCDRCGVIFLVNVPSDLARYYPDQYYELPSPDQLSRLSGPEREKVQLLREHVQSGRLVEVGPGYGGFAYQAMQAGFDVSAIEMDSRCCEYLTSVLGVPAQQSDSPHQVLSTMPPSGAIVLWHVLEHLPELWLCLQSAARNLEQGGVLVVATPNPQALQLRVLGSRWPHIDAPRHLHLIPATTLVSHAKDLRLECVMLTTAGPGWRKYDLFGWQQAFSVMRSGSGRLSRYLALGAGEVVAALLGPFERRRLRGSTYAAVFRKTAGQ